MKRIFIFLISCFLYFGSICIGQPTYTDSKIREMISKMTIDEKINFIGGFEQFNIREVKESGIPLVRSSDGPVGVRNYGPSTAYPTSVLLAASWDTEMANKIGSAIGKEAKAKNVHIMLGPGMNIYRAPMNGRNFEYVGEDPYLAGKIASNYIIGLQNQGVMATAKHYLANYQEFDRHKVSSDMDERTMQEIYLPAFKACVQEGKVAAIMTSYNLVNGIHASQHDLAINKILKGDWGFEGFVMSDWTSVYDGVAAANAGLDLEMPSGIHMCNDTLKEAIKSGKLLEKTIDDKVFRILKQYARFGFFSNPVISNGYVLDSIWVRNIAIEAARGGIVLLKNENNYLPLNKSKIKSIALIGPNADPVVSGGGGSARVNPLYPMSLYKSMQQEFGSSVKINLETGVFGQQPRPVEFYNKSDFYTYKDGKKMPGLTVDFYKNRRSQVSDYQEIFPIINREFKDSLPGIPRSNYSAKFSGFIKAEKTGKYNFIVSTDAGFRLKINDVQVVDAWRSPVEATQTGVISLEAGKEYKVSLTYNQNKSTGVIRMTYETPDVYEQNLANNLNNISKTAKESDLVVLSIGFNPKTEGEGFDRKIELPEIQKLIINEVLKTNKDFVVVLNSGGNVDMSTWLPKAKALIHAWYPGQEGNKAVAEILLGITNPSGKLPVSFEKQWSDNPTFNNYYDTDSDKHVKFNEGIFVGYRHYDKKNVEPLFPFGFGLSYTTFEYSDLTLSKSKIKSSDEVTVTLKVKNTGAMDGAEIVQLYVSDLVSSYPRPVKELKSFAKVWLKKGESKVVSFKLNQEAFHYFNPDTHKWFVEPGEFEIIAASSSKDIRLKKLIAVAD
jgi:beta-glucosidase